MNGLLKQRDAEIEKLKNDLKNLQNQLADWQNRYKQLEA